MANTELLKRIVVEPAVCFGKRCVIGVRIGMTLRSASLAEGATASDLLEAYSPLTIEDIHAAMASGAQATHGTRTPEEG